MKYQDFLKAKQSHVKPVGFDVDAGEINRRLFDEKQETIADIVSEMREFADTDSQTIGRDVLRRRIQHFARRFEAAAKREREATREKSSLVGNAVKMREALENIASMGEQIDYQLGSSEETVYALRHERCLAHNISECARSVLSATPRNCDVGTPEEQDARHSKWCRKYGIDGDIEVACAHQYMSCTLCALRWAQMPYEEGCEK